MWKLWYTDVNWGQGSEWASLGKENTARGDSHRTDSTLHGRQRVRGGQRRQEEQSEKSAEIRKTVSQKLKEVDKDPFSKGRTQTKKDLALGSIPGSIRMTSVKLTKYSEP